MSVATLMPRPTRRGRRTWKPRAPLAVRVRRLPDRLPEVRVVTREELRASRVVVVQVRDDDEVHVVGLEPERVETLDQQVRLGEARHRVVAHETGDGPGREAGVEEDDRVGGANEPAGDGDLHPLARELAVEEPRALEAHEAVLQRVERLDRHAATF